MRKTIKGQPLKALLKKIKVGEYHVISLDELMSAEDFKVVSLKELGFKANNIYTKEDAMRNLIDSASKSYKDIYWDKDYRKENT